MHPSRNFLDHIVDFLGPLYPHDFPAVENSNRPGAHLITYKDLLIEGPIGWMRPVHSREKHVAGAFVARHPDEHAAEETRDGRLEIKHKGKAPLLALFNTHARTRQRGGKTVTLLNLGRVMDRMKTLCNALPGVLLRETTLYRLDEYTFISGTMAYVAQPCGHGKMTIDVITHLDPRYAALAGDMFNRNDVKRAWMVRLFRRTGEVLVKKCAALPTLHVSYDASMAGEEPNIITEFPEASWIEAMAADHRKRVRDIRRGRDPFQWLKQPLLPLFYAQARAIQRAHTLWETTLSGRRLAYETFRLGVIGTLFGGYWAATRLIGTAAGLSELEKPEAVPRQCHDLVDMRIFRLIFVSAQVYRLLIHTVAKGFGDLCYVNPETYEVPGNISPLKSTDLSRDYFFQRWLESHLKSPYAPAVEFRDEKGKLLDPRNEEELEKCNVAVYTYSNSLSYYVDTTAWTAYAYARHLSYDTDEKDFPHDAAKYLPKNKVWVLDPLHPDKPAAQIDFSDFKQRMAKLARLKNLPRPDVPHPSLIRSEEGPPLEPPMDLTAPSFSLISTLRTA